MATMKITIEDMGITKTLEKDFGEGLGIHTGDFFETCLECYDAQGYMNNISIDIYGLGGNVTQNLTWTKENYISVNEEMSIAEDLMDYLGREDVNSSRGIGWYMGHRY